MGRTAAHNTSMGSTPPPLFCSSPPPVSRLPLLPTPTSLPGVALPPPPPPRCPMRSYPGLIPDTTAHAAGLTMGGLATPHLGGDHLTQPSQNSPTLRVPTLHHVHHDHVCPYTHFVSLLSSCNCRDRLSRSACSSLTHALSRPTSAVVSGLRYIMLRPRVGLKRLERKAERSQAHQYAAHRMDGSEQPGQVEKTCN